MNERIKELADQIGLGVQYNGIVLTKNVNAAEAFQKFAELIIKECIDAAIEAQADFYVVNNIRSRFEVE